MNAILTAQKLKVQSSDYASSNLALTMSVILHISILIISGITVTLTKPKTQIIDTPPIEVQFIQPEELEKEQAPEPVEEPKASSNMAPKALEKPEPPQPKDIPVEEEVDKPAQKEQAPPPPAPAPVPIKKDTSLAKDLIEQARQKKEEQAAKPDTSEFTSVLKNLVGEKNPTPREITEEEVEPNTQFPEAVLTRGTALNLSEQNAIRDQLAGCWNVIPGARDADNLVVAVTLEMNPNATVRSARIVDQARYNSDPFFRAAADSALRAVRNQQCSPLKLPLNKYDQWKKITIRFDPKDMF